VITNNPAYDIGSGSLTNTLILTPNPYNAMSTSTNGTCPKLVGSSLCQFVASFTLVNPVPALGTGKIKVNIPAGLSITSTTCTVMLGAAAGVCAAISATEFEIVSLATIPANTVITLTFPTFK
jgi:hypothetical protein